MVSILSRAPCPLRSITSEGRSYLQPSHFKTQRILNLKISFKYLPNFPVLKRLTKQVTEVLSSIWKPGLSDSKH